MTITRARGLTSAEAATSLERFGANEMPTATRPAVWRQVVAQLTHFFAIMLWVAAALALLAGLPALSVAISVIVVLNGVFAFVQEHRADRATEKLGELMPALARVRRNGRPCTIAVRDVVPGDLVLLTAGDRVPADLTVTAGCQRPADSGREICPPKPGKETIVVAEPAAALGVEPRL